MNNKIKIFLCFLFVGTLYAPEGEEFTAAVHNPMAEARAHTNMLLERAPHLLHTLGCGKLVIRKPLWSSKEKSEPLSCKEWGKEKSEANSHEATTHVLGNMASFCIEGGYILYLKKGNILNQLILKNCEALTGSEQRKAGSVMESLARILLDEERKTDDKSAQPVRLGSLPKIQDEMREMLKLPDLTMTLSPTSLISDLIREGYKAFEIMFDLSNSGPDEVDKIAKGMLCCNPLLEMHFQDPKTYLVRLSDNAVLRIHDPERRFITESNFGSTFNANAFVGSKLPWDDSETLKVDVWYKVDEYALHFKFANLAFYRKSVFADSCNMRHHHTKTDTHPAIFRKEAFPSFPEVAGITEERSFVDAATQTTDLPE